ncbi:uncharacterized protein SPAPADRAFT_155003, partial [Spathaspora passalidarum NRRL Y-27907]
MLFLLLLLALQTALGATKYVNAFTSFDDLKFMTPKRPSQPFQVYWEATLSWSLKSSEIQPYDTFGLILPCVFKFATNENTLTLKVNEVELAFCSLISGELKETFSKLDCIALPGVTLGNSKGGIKLPFTFNVGGSALSTDLETSKCFTAGKNIISFYDGDKELSYPAFFETMFESGGKHDADEVVYGARSLENMKWLQNYLLAGNCPQGYTSGKLGFTILQGAKIDCNTIHAYISNKFNDWFFPTTFEEMKMTINCSENEVLIEYQNISPGYRPYLDGLISTRLGHDTKMKYVNQYTCNNETVKSNDVIVNWANYQPIYPTNTGGTLVVQELISSTTTSDGLSTIDSETYENEDPIPTVATNNEY